jgi:Tol biopolymer transport system component
MRQLTKIPTLRRSPYAVALLFAVGFAVVGVLTGQTQAEAPQEGIPQIEPRYTQVFGSDTMNIMNPRISPDGRWIVYSQQTGAESTAGLRLLSVEGGEPIELTNGNWDVRPWWFPTSERIAFQSDAVDGLMTIAIDPETGAPAGPAQRVTLEPAFGPSPVSPDGQWIAYRVWANEGPEQGMALKVIPARGGNARTVMRLPRKPQLRFWSQDGRYVYFVWSDPAGTPARLWRVAVDGGDPEVVEKVPTGPSGPARRFRLARGGPTEVGGDLVHEIQTWDERPLARVTLPRDMGLAGFAADGRHLLAVVRNSVHPLRILPVAGGAMRQLGDARTYDTPIGWTPDGERVIYQTRLDGREAMMVAPVERGAAEEFVVIPDLPRSGYRSPVLVSESGRYLAYTSWTEGEEIKALSIVRVADGESRQVSDSTAWITLFGLAAPGGEATMGDQFLHMDRRNNRHELRFTSYDGSSRLLRSFPVDLGTRPAWGVFGNRVAWVEAVGDSTVILIADGPDAEPRQLAMTHGLYDDLVFSRDGRWLAASFYLSSDDMENSFRILLLEMNRDGTAAGAPRLIEATIGVGWGIRWLPDNQTFTIFAQTIPGWGTDVYRVSVNEGVPPVAITRDEDSDFWYYQLSPDGRYIAYPGTIRRGSSLWLIDLGDALASGT